MKSSCEMDITHSKYLTHNYLLLQFFTLSIKYVAKIDLFSFEEVHDAICFGLRKQMKYCITQAEVQDGLGVSLGLARQRS